MKILKILFPLFFVLWLFTLGIHFHHEERHYKFRFQSVSNLDVELGPIVYTHDFNYRDHSFYYGIPYVLSYSGLIQPLPGDLRLRFYTSDKLIGADVFVESVYVKYHNDNNHEKIQCGKPLSKGTISEKTFNPGYTGAITEVTYETEVEVFDCITKREDFDLTTSGYVLNKGEKIKFEITNQAHYLKSGVTWLPGWLLLYVQLTGGA